MTLQWIARLVVLLLLGVAPLRGGHAAEAGGKRVALVVGNGAYRNVDPLQNSANDARLIAATLQQLGFTLVGGGALVDLNRAQLAEAVQGFGRALAGAEVGLFYYSGHGLQVQGVNWLVPVDANPTRPQDLDFQMVDADLILRQMDGAGTKLNIVILDACRNNPFASRGLRGMSGGLAEMRAPEGTLISYATQPGNVAADGAGADSPYTTALAASMRQPGLDIFRMFNQVGLQVKRTTGGSQQPWVSNSPIEGEFYFNATPPGPPTPAPLALSTLPAAPVPTPPPEERLRALARTLPCALVRARINGNRIELSGQALDGPDWQQFLHTASSNRGIESVASAVERLSAFECGPVELLGKYIPSSPEGGILRVHTEQTNANDRVHVVVEGAPAGAELHVDLFAGDGTVRHVVARADATPQRIDQATGTAPGPRLLTVIALAGSLDLGARPASERADTYLAALQHALGARSDDADVRAELTTLEVRKIEAAVPPPVHRAAPAAAVSGRCANLMERAQLGDTLSDADRATVRGGCR